MFTAEQDALLLWVCLSNDENVLVDVAATHVSTDRCLVCFLISTPPSCRFERERIVPLPPLLVRSLMDIVPSWFFYVITGLRRMKCSFPVSVAAVTPWVTSPVSVSRWSRLRVCRSSHSTRTRRRSPARNLGRQTALGLPWRGVA